MAQALYTVSTGSAFFNSLASPALQTALTVTSTATDYGIQLKKYRLGFNGIAATQTPVLCRLYVYTVATAGTSTTATTAITQVAGRTIAATNFAAASNYTAEPTAKTYFEEFTLTPNGGTVIYDYYPGDEPDYFNSGAQGFGIEVTPGAQVGVQAAFWFTRI